MKLRLPWTSTWEWTTVLPDDHPMAPFTNGSVTSGDGPVKLLNSRGVLFRRRTAALAWRGRWRVAEIGSRYGEEPETPA